jgi:hypothetical protein
MHKANNVEYHNEIDMMGKENNHLIWKKNTISIDHENHSPIVGFSASTINE